MSIITVTIKAEDLDSLAMAAGDVQYEAEGVLTADKLALLCTQYPKRFSGDGWSYTIESHKQEGAKQ